MLNKIVANSKKELKENLNNTKNYVFDSSIVQIKSLNNLLSKISETESLIIITDVTIKEFKRMKKFDDLPAIMSRRILSEAARDAKRFLPVKISDTYEANKEGIVNYCADNRDSVILITADEEMALMARMLSVETEFYYQEKYGERLVSLCCTKKEDKDLFIYNTNLRWRAISVFSEGIEYKVLNQRALKKGDEVFLITRRDDYLAFAHYKVTSLEEKSNSILIYSKRIYERKEILQEIKEPKYITFIQDFIDT